MIQDISDSATRHSSTSSFSSAAEKSGRGVTKMQCEDAPTASLLASVNEVSHRDNLLAALRYASARMGLAKNNLDFVGVALKRGLISVEYAIDWVGELGALPLIETTLEVTRA